MYTSHVVSWIEQKNSTSLFLPWLSSNVTEGLIALTPEMDYNQTAMSLPQMLTANAGGTA
jgi:hypothetical protein